MFLTTKTITSFINW